MDKLLKDRIVVALSTNNKCRQCYQHPNFLIIISCGLDIISSADDAVSSEVIYHNLFALERRKKESHSKNWTFHDFADIDSGEKQANLAQSKITIYANHYKKNLFSTYMKCQS